MADVLRIANCSGFYGDRLSAAREMVEGGPIDVLTGDYLAELTLMILFRDRLKNPAAGYARTFLRQMEEVLGTCVGRGIKVVVNAGGLNPAGLAAELDQLATRLGVRARIAHVEGDDLLPRAADLGLGSPLTANAYLGAFGIAECLRAGADVVVTGRVTDASLVVGPAVAHHGWAADDHDAVAGAVVAGHVLECGTQATGGNFSGFASLPADARSRPLGFPLAEVAADGSCVVTKHDDITKENGPYTANGSMGTLRAIYNHARKSNKSLPADNPVNAIDWNGEQRRDTGMGTSDLKGWLAE